MNNSLTTPDLPPADRHLLEADRLPELISIGYQSGWKNVLHNAWIANNKYLFQKFGYEQVMSWMRLAKPVQLLCFAGESRTAVYVEDFDCELDYDEEKCLYVLGHEITVYRGGSGPAEYLCGGPSWSTSREIAESFAAKFPDGIVVEGRIGRAAILMSFLSEAESELVIDPTQLISVCDLSAI